VASAFNTEAAVQYAELLKITTVSQNAAASFFRFCLFHNKGINLSAVNSSGGAL
jgi:hypothetical protein